MVTALAFAFVLLAGIYLIGLGVVGLLRPTAAARFLLGFAGSARAHYAEMFVRLVVGGAFLLHAPRMLFPEAFLVFGWVLVLTTAALFVLPWKLHRRFAQWTVPSVVRHLRLVAVVALLFGGVILGAVILGAA